MNASTNKIRYLVEEFVVACMKSLKYRDLVRWFLKQMLRR